ncbi:hypothetical protein CMI47_10635 [Candidatus Pacearchaeota archaeon]|nr:hypothetical protein [Candidatus Pacearchaeota archaeon]|tara:strand:- start:167 stop:427 length:261 start_codon:yes stop_codon:yes gene_type:complete
MGMGITKDTHETWEEVMLMRARKWGMEEEVKATYAEALAEGKEPHDAVWCALFEWDLLDLIPSKQVKASKRVPRWVPREEQDDAGE